MNEIDLSKDIFTLVKNNVLLKARFLEIMIYRLDVKDTNIISFGTNGKTIYYSPLFLIDYFKRNKVNTSRLFLHSCFHSLLRNPFTSKLRDNDFWDVACDICVENILDEFDVETFNRVGKEQRSNIIKDIKKHVSYIHPDYVYDYLKNNSSILQQYKEIFEVDDHSTWDGRSNSNLDLLEDCSKGNECHNLSCNCNDNTSSDLNLNNIQNSDVYENMWNDISKKLLVEMTHFSKEIGVNVGALLFQLEKLNKEKYDYESFLRKFAVLQETPKLNVDEFDMIFYTYGLDTYGNMPLVEPLEYKEDYLIKDFVIAIDTSGSVQGEVVKSFLTKTYNILESTTSFCRAFNLHIIQCDDKIQQSVKITTKKEFDNYIEKCKLYGFGGTDFRPVFRYVDEMINNNEFKKLKGLIYFTDGYGKFPNKKTSYDTCFAFVNQIDYDSVEVPVWAKKIFLEIEDI